MQETWFLLGDIHGDVYPIRRFYERNKEKLLPEAEQDLDYKRWAFGHYHADRLYPRNNGKQMLMLFNEKMVDLEKFMKMQEGDGLESIVVG